MKFFAGTLSVVVLVLTMSAPLTVSAFNDNQEACSIPTNEFVSLIQSIKHAEENFLFGTEELVPRMWRGAILGLNDSLSEPLEHEALDQMILFLRDREEMIPELELFLRTPEAHAEQRAKDFFLFASHLCERGLITKAEMHTEAAIRRAHASLNDEHSRYLSPAEAERYRIESVSEAQEIESIGGRSGLAHFNQLGINTYIVTINSFFSQYVADDVRNALELIVSQCSFPNIILDLRNNGGGFTDASIEVSRNFLRDRTIVQFENREGLRESFIANADANNFHFMSVTVLINGSTASAAEIVAAALGENGALTVGSRTYGKAVGQRVQHLSNGWASRITSFRIYSPQGSSWQGVGITPIVDIENTVFSLADEGTDAETEGGMTACCVDRLVLASYQLIKENESWDPRCKP